MLQATTAVDLILDAYVDWREASESVERAYAAWGQAGGPRRSGAFDIYAAALDREERAAAEYRRCLERCATLQG